jgi:hypothetical protein
MTDCSERHRIAEIERRLGTGDVTLATMHQTQLQILEQVRATNGRVTRLERFKAAVSWLSLGIVVSVLAAKFGLGELILRML